MSAGTMYMALVVLATAERLGFAKGQEIALDGLGALLGPCPSFTQLANLYEPGTNAFCLLLILGWSS
jgi:hypothetical protein